MTKTSTDKARVIPAGRLGMGWWSEGWSQDDAGRHPIEEKWLEKVSALVPASGEINLVDAGSGNGNRFLPFAAKLTDDHSVVVTLVDIQSDAFDNLSNTLRNPAFPKHLEVKPIVGSVVNLSVESSTQHGIYCESVLPWLGNEVDIKKALKEFHRTLIPGGFVYIEVMSPFNNSSVNDIPGKSSQERVKEIQKYIANNPGKAYSYNNPKYGRPVVYMSEPVLKSFVTSAGFIDIISSPFKNTDFPNGLNSDEFPDNIELMARKP